MEKATTQGISYRIILRAGDGTEWNCGRIRADNFDKEWRKIGNEVKKTIIDHDITYFVTII